MDLTIGVALSPLYAVLTGIVGVVLAVAGVVLLFGVGAGLMVAGVCVVVGAVVLYDPGHRDGKT